jgi:hypothetical protein
MANSPQICLNRGQATHIKFILSRIVKMRLPWGFLPGLLPLNFQLQSFSFHELIEWLAYVNGLFCYR